MLVRAFAALALVLFLGAGPPVFAAQSDGHVLLAQATPAPGQPDVTGDLPSGTWILALVGIGLAVYVSSRLGHKQEGDVRRREGPISKALGGTARRPEREGR